MQRLDLNLNKEKKSKHIWSLCEVKFCSMQNVKCNGRSESRKIVGELVARSHERPFSLVCCSTKRDTISVVAPKGFQRQ